MFDKIKTGPFTPTTIGNDHHGHKCLDPQKSEVWAYRYVVAIAARMLYRKRAELCFESILSEERPHWVLWGTRRALRKKRWVLRKRTRWVRFGTQIIGWEELAEFSPRNSVRANTEPYSPKPFSAHFQLAVFCPKHHVRLCFTFSVFFIFLVRYLQGSFFFFQIYRLFASISVPEGGRGGLAGLGASFLWGEGWGVGGGLSTWPWQ